MAKPWVARCEGGPFDGRDAMLGVEPSGKLIRVWESLLMEGSLMHDENVDELADGDAVYEEVQRSQLSEDECPDVIMRGGVYRFKEACTAE